MKVVTATRTGQGDRPGDFCRTVEGELVVVLDACARDRARMDELFPATRLVRVKHAGHWVHSEQPEVFLAALQRFLVSVEGSA